MTKYVAILNATAIPKESWSRLTAVFFNTTGVPDITSTSLKVLENSPTGLSVIVKAGDGVFKDGLMTFHGFSDTDEVLSISANASGNDRIDAQVAYIDKGATSNADGSNVFKFINIQGTPSASPAAPSDVTIQAGVGAGNPFIRISESRVNNATSSITNSLITDKRSRAQGLVDKAKEGVRFAWHIPYSINVLDRQSSVYRLDKAMTIVAIKGITSAGSANIRFKNGATVLATATITTTGENTVSISAPALVINDAVQLDVTSITSTPSDMTVILICEMNVSF